jgi:hypothetical protein
MKGISLALNCTRAIRNILLASTDSQPGTLVSSTLRFAATRRCPCPVPRITMVAAACSPAIPVQEICGPPQIPRRRASGASAAERINCPSWTVANAGRLGRNGKSEHCPEVPTAQMVWKPGLRCLRHHHLEVAGSGVSGRRHADGDAAVHALAAQLSL